MDELEWQKNVLHIMVLAKSGFPLFSQPLQTRNAALRTNLILVDGVVVRISSIIREIIRARALQLKIVKQENHSVMIEEGTHVLVAIMVKEELKTVRKRMLGFIEDFESFFEDLLLEWKGDTDVFSPAKILVNKHFKQV
ncbi:MAG: hypothetical protein ACFFD4_34645 [Candidatus Odinarchaeota archaeon]